jgi:N-acetylglutamate synthase-like GNAT family acetyltransferase
MESINIRQATLKDSQELARLMGDLGYPASVAQMQARLQKIFTSEDYQTFVADTGNGLRGMIGVRIGMGYERDGLLAQIVCLVVDESVRGKGIGKRLVNQAESWAKEKSADKLSVTTALRRTDTHRFYETACGLSRTGYRFAREI